MITSGEQAWESQILTFPRIQFYSLNSFQERITLAIKIEASVCFLPSEMKIRLQCSKI